MIHMVTYRHMKAEKHVVIEPMITYRHIVWITYWFHSQLELMDVLHEMHQRLENSVSVG